MSGQGTSNTSLFSIASIRNSIVAKINASDLPVNNPVKDEEIVSPTKQCPSITSKLESDDNIDGFPVTVSNFNKKSPPMKRDTDASADESEEVTAADSITGTLQTKEHCEKTDNNIASTVAIDANESTDGAMDNAMDVETSSTSESVLISPATNVPATDQQSEIISEVAENGRVTGKGQSLGRSFESNGHSQSTAETSTFYSVIVKTEIEDDGYPCHSQQCTDRSEDDAYNINDNDVPRPFDSAVSVIKTKVVDNGFPFQGELMLTSTDFSQLVSESTESMIIKQEMPDSCSEDVGEQTDEDVAITRVEYRLADSDGEREDSSSDSLSSDIEFPERRYRASDEDDEFFGKPFKKNRYGFDDVRTSGEVLPEELPPIEGLTINIGEDTELQEIGVIDSIVGMLVIIRSSVEHSPLQDDTVFFLENRKPIGQVFETMGQVRMPFYSIRFNSVEEITERGVEIGKKVLFAPTVAEITHYVFVAQLKRLKGSDASWENNNEPPQTHVEYSDDENERLSKAKRRGRKKNAANVDSAGSSSDSDDSDSGEKKAKRPNKKHGDGENRGRGRGRRGRNFRAGRGGGGDAQPNTTDQPSGRWPPSDWSSKRFAPSSRPPHFDWDQPGNSAPPPRPPPINPNYNTPRPWNMGGPGNGVLQMPRFPPAQFCPRPSGPNMWGPPPPPPFAPAVSGPHCGPPPFRPPPPPPPSPVNGIPPAFQGGPPFSRPGPPPSPHSPHPGNVPPVFNPNVPPPPFNPSVSPSPFSMPPPSPNSSQFGSQPKFTAAPWGSGGQGAPFWVSSPQGTVASSHSGPLYSSQGQQSSGCFSVSSSAPATQGTVVSSTTATIMSSVASKRPVLDTRYMQNSGE